MTDIPLSLLGCHVAHGRYPLSFQTAEYSLHRRVVVAIISVTHALAYAISPKALAKLSAPILGALSGHSEVGIQLPICFFYSLSALKAP